MSNSSDSPPRNRLGHASSPYLRQHASNPVAWQPWDDAALALARALDRPILLSIGYSACHWCHVMAHESFADEATARVLNDAFVNVKVDREERPDLDRAYQLAHQVLTRHGGGWPLTMFLAPDDLVPFFGGTYFPPVARQGMPAFAELASRVARYFRAERAAIRAQNGRLLALFAGLAAEAPAVDLVLDAAPLARARAELERSFDPEFGGHTRAPKFPHPGHATRLLRSWRASAHEPEPDLRALYMATLTLTRMAEGGLYDHVGGGFARYSTDAWWMIPHFEKMLYDNAQLLALYADAAVATGEPLFRRAALGTAAWLLAELQAPHGGLGSSLDADSEGHEGRYYVWDRAEVEAALPAAQYAPLARRYGLDRAPNFEGRHHLHAYVAVPELAAELGLSVEAAQQAIDDGLARLASVRAARERPALDDKVLAAWNGLAIGGLARAARAFDAAPLADAATRAADFLRAELWRDGRLHASWHAGAVGVPGFLDDHAFLLDGLLALLEVRWRAADLAFARELADALLERFEDRGRGGFWFTAHDAPAPLHRSQTWADEALPSGNGVAARALGRLGHLLAEPRYLAAAERTLRAAWSSLADHPRAHGALLDALEEWLAPPELVILRGTSGALAGWQRELATLYAPRRAVYAIPADAAALPPALAGKRAQGRADTDVTAWVCTGSTCEAPIDTLPRLVRRLRDGIVLAEA